MPALWLSEIERRTRRPISHLFNMAAGTSTGGIIAAGLPTAFVEAQAKWVDVATPTGMTIQYKVKERMLFSYRPRYSAADILELYTEY